MVPQKFIKHNRTFSSSLDKESNWLKGNLFEDDNNKNIPTAVAGQGRQLKN